MSFCVRLIRRCRHISIYTNYKLYAVKKKKCVIIDIKVLNVAWQVEAVSYFYPNAVCTNLHGYEYCKLTGPAN